MILILQLPILQDQYSTVQVCVPPPPSNVEDEAQ